MALAIEISQVKSGGMGWLLSEVDGSLMPGFDRVMSQRQTPPADSGGERSSMIVDEHRGDNLHGKKFEYFRVANQWFSRQ